MDGCQASNSHGALQMRKPQFCKCQKKPSQATALQKRFQTMKELQTERLGLSLAVRLRRSRLAKYLSEEPSVRAMSWCCKPREGRLARALSRSATTKQHECLKAAKGQCHSHGNGVANGAPSAQRTAGWLYQTHVIKKHAGKLPLVNEREGGIKRRRC